MFWIFGNLRTTRQAATSGSNRAAFNSDTIIIWTGFTASRNKTGVAKKGMPARYSDTVNVWQHYYIKLFWGTCLGISVVVGVSTEKWNVSCQEENSSPTGYFSTTMTVNNTDADLSDLRSRCVPQLLLLRTAGEYCCGLGRWRARGVTVPEPARPELWRSIDFQGGGLTLNSWHLIDLNIQTVRLQNNHFK